MQVNINTLTSIVAKKRIAIPLLFLALILRIAFFPKESVDYLEFIEPWYSYIQLHGGFAALKTQFSDYNVPYLTLLAAASYLPLDALVVSKSISVIFDGILAYFVYLFVRLKYEKKEIALGAAIIMLFLPTVVLNSSAWAQCDSIYTTFCIGSMYFYCRKRPFWACIFFGLAISFKLQAIFLAPILLVLLIKRRVPFRYFLLIPAVFLLTIVPALMAGGKLWDILKIYQVQSDVFDSLKMLTLNAPNLYQWISIPPSWFYIAKDLGIVLTGIVVAVLIGGILQGRKSLTSAYLVKMTLLFTVGIPFFLPMMHERYFYIADVFSVIYAFWNPEYYYFPLLIQLSSLDSYILFLFDISAIPLSFVAFAPFIVLILTGVDLFIHLYSKKDETSKSFVCKES
jgi:Gpi18-like mannosyltransferase